MDALREPINVSALNQYAYCPRRCGFIYLEGEFNDNIHTQRGNAEHARVDRVTHTTASAGARVEYALPIWSDRLGLIGKATWWSSGPTGRSIRSSTSTARAAYG
jgi:CRISPR-associated exonuclease Cas4